MWQRCQISHKPFYKLYNSAFASGHYYGDVKESIDELHKLIRALCKERGANSKEMRIVFELLNQLYLLTGNVKKHQKL